MGSNRFLLFEVLERSPYPLLPLLLLLLLMLLLLSLPADASTDECGVLVGAATAVEAANEAAVEDRVLLVAGIVVCCILCD